MDDTFEICTPWVQRAVDRRGFTDFEGVIDQSSGAGGGRIALAQRE